MNRVVLIAAPVAALILIGCGGEDCPPGTYDFNGTCVPLGGVDRDAAGAGGDSDVGSADTGGTDAGGTDAGGTDTGGVDAGGTDGGTGTGGSDSGSDDTGTTDTGTTDTGTTDTGTTDTGTTDTIEVGDGACTNAADQAVLVENADTITGTTGNCGLTCFSGGGDTETCAAECVQTETGLSADCSACFGQSVSCTLTACLLSCFDPESAACIECVEVSCGADFEACAGVSFP